MDRHYARALLKPLVLAGVVALLVLLLVAGEAQPAYAATITVNTTDDELNSDGDCSLREAIQAANTNAAVDDCTAGSSGTDIIVFDGSVVPGTFTLTILGQGEDVNATGDLDITDDLTITGDGQTTTIIDGADLDRVFHILTGMVTISRVTIQNGSAILGGGILGGGIRNGGTLTVNASTVSGNSAFGGGGIFNSGTLTLNNSTVSGNMAADGGGITNFLPGTVTLNSSTVSGNTASVGLPEGDGGGIRNDSTLTLNNSTVSGNATNSEGGGIASVGTVTLLNSTVSQNTAGSFGGGIFNSVLGTVTIDSSTVSGNTTNSGGGGIFSVGTVALNNSTVSGNTASGSGGIVSGGGGMFNVGGTLTLNNSTVARNMASLGGGGIRNQFGGTTTLKNTIVANNTSDDCSVVFTGTITSLDHNLDSDNTCGLTGGNDIPNGSANLGLLALNAPGNTETHALLLPSAAIDKIPVADCTDTLGNPITADQRGFPRPQGPDCDIGAFERHAGEHDVEAVRIGAPPPKLFQGCNSNPCTFTRTHVLIVRNNSSDHSDDIGVDYKVLGWPAACTVSSPQFGTQSGGASITVNNTVAFGVPPRASAATSVVLTFSCPASAVGLIGTAFVLRFEAAHPTRPDDVPSNDIVTRVQIIS